VERKDQKKLYADMNTIYEPSTTDEAALSLQTMADKSDVEYQAVSKFWQVS
jgi:transposase-like protein